MEIERNKEKSEMREDKNWEEKVEIPSIFDVKEQRIKQPRLT